MKNRLISMIIIVLVIWALLPATALADGETITDCTMIDDTSKTHTAFPANPVTLKATANMSNLTVGETYTLKATLMDKDTGAPLLVGGGIVTGTEPFAAGATTVNHDISFGFDASALDRKGVVVFLELNYSGQILATYEQINHSDATVTFDSNPLAFTDSASYDIPASTEGSAITGIDVAGGVSGGVAPYTFSAAGLPAGITVSSAGIISGTPAAARAAGEATVTVTDSENRTKSITINFGAISASQEHTPTNNPGLSNPTDTSRDVTITFPGEFSQVARILLNDNVLTQVVIDATSISVSGYPGYTGNSGKASEGSVEVTLFKEFLQWLPNGEYTLVVEFNDGATVTSGKAEFLIKRDDATPTSTGGSPKTGDDTNIGLWIALMAIAGAALIGIFLYSRRPIGRGKTRIER